MSRSEPASSLEERLREHIRREGPISFYEWMKAALYDQHDGYYCRADRIRQGRAGDYRTAPETSALFAATFAHYFSKLFAQLNCPPSWTIFEAGAAGGDFAHGVLTNLRSHYPQVFTATKYVVDEVGADAWRAADRVSEFSDKVSFQRLDEVHDPPTTGIVFSNELLDAFPVHRVITSAGKLRELCVGLAKTEFTWVECDVDPRVADYCQKSGMQLAEGQIAEVNLKAEEFISRAAALLDPGFLITVDYGAERKDLWSASERRMGTLRAFHRHQVSDNVLARPGEQDLTTTIDWTQIKEAGQRAGLQTLALQRLDQFLLSEGILEIMQTTMREANDPTEALRLSTSARELVLPNGMASYFQVLVQTKQPLPPLLLKN
jgi:SAM-dependent MidA family methyltransferase